MQISVVICTRNRKEDLLKSLKGFYKQDYEDFEIIIIDNASEDGTKEAVMSLYPEVNYTYLPVNINILAQNIGVYKAKGDIIWRTDSDAFPLTIDVFSKVINLFEKYPYIDIISTKEYNSRVGKEFPLTSAVINSDEIPKDGYEAKSFMGAGTAIKKSVFDKIGGYWEFGMEEIDFSTRALREGFVIRYFPNLKTNHLSSLHDRNENQRWLSISLQMSRYIVKYYPFLKLITNTFLCFWVQLIYALKKRISFKYIFLYLFEFHSVFIKTIIEERNPLNKKEYDKILKGNLYSTSSLKFIKSILRKK